MQPALTSARPPHAFEMGRHRAMSDNTLVIDLAGTWRLGWQDVRRGDAMTTEWPTERQQDWLDALVPGEVHRDLERHGILDPIESGLGALRAQWVDRATWIFLRDFELDEVPASAELVFERLELCAAIYVNGHRVGSHDNVFLPLRIDVTPYLQAGANRVRVELDGGQHLVADLPTKGYRRSVMQGPDKRHWLRAGQSQFGWDWSPRLVNIGITGPVRLEMRSVPVRIGHVVPIVDVASDHSSALVETRVFVVNATNRDERATLRLHLDDQMQSLDVVLPPGESRIDFLDRIENPTLWWPRGMGAQHRCSLAIELALPGSGTSEVRTLELGLRSIQLDQSPAPDRGTLFRIKVNGVPFFAKGGNWVPISLTPNPVPVELLDRQLTRAVEAEFNFLRVWGGGDYETDEFYDRCDVLGILVWQDLIFACSRYPMGNDWFRESVEDEVRHQIRRLARHPSLGLWCGNNENAWIGQGEGFPGPLVPRDDGTPLAEVQADHQWFETEAMNIARAEDPSRPFWPSSPWSPVDADHNAGHEGDQHPWSIGFTDVDFRKYRDMDARFPNEGGLLGASSLPALLTSLPEDQRFFGSFAWKTHDNEMIMRFPTRAYDEQLRDWTGLDVRQLSLEGYVYWTGLLQGEGLSEYVDNFRRRAHTTSAAVFWMYNDCWPTVRSWTIVDSEGRRTPSFHPVRRAFSPVRVGIRQAAKEGLGDAFVWVHNDTQDDVSLTLECGHLTFAGEMHTNHHPITVPARSVAEVAQLTAPDGDVHSSAYVAILRSGEQIISRNRLLPGKFSDLRLPDVDVRVHLEDLQDGRREAVFESDVFVLGVCLDLDGEGDLADNFFDLYPGLSHRVPWTHAQPPEVKFTGNSAGADS